MFPVQIIGGNVSFNCINYVFLQKLYVSKFQDYIQIESNLYKRLESDCPSLRLVTTTSHGVIALPEQDTPLVGPPAEPMARSVHPFVPIGRRPLASPNRNR